MAYTYGASKRTDRSIARSIQNAQQRRARLTKRLAGITSEVEALSRAEDTIKTAQKQAVDLCEQALKESRELKALATREAYAIVANAQHDAELIDQQARRDARAIREQAYDFGLAQLDRDYPTRQDRTRERERAKRTLVKHYAKQRLLAATNEAAEWDRNRKAAA